MFRLCLSRGLGGEFGQVVMGFMLVPKRFKGCKTSMLDGAVFLVER